MNPRPTLASADLEIVDFVSSWIDHLIRDGYESAIALLDDSIEGDRRKWTKEEWDEELDRYDEAGSITPPRDVPDLQTEVHRYIDGSGFSVHYDLPVNGTRSYFTLQFDFRAIGAGMHVALDDLSTVRHDHDLDWPWTLYFNGEAVPRWANCWNLCPLPKRTSALFIDYPWLVDYSDFVRLRNRMGSAHTVDSEDPVLFRIQCLSFLVLLLRHETHFRAALAPRAEEEGTTASTIFEGIRDGLVAMHRLTVRDRFAFWTAGYKRDKTRLVEEIRQSRLPPAPEDYVAPPHIRERNQVAGVRFHSLRCELHDLLRTQHYPKDLRRFIHELPTFTALGFQTKRRQRLPPASGAKDHAEYSSE